MADDVQKRVIQHAQKDLGNIGPEVACEPNPTLGSKIMDYIADRLAPEIGDMLMQKTSQGAGEIALAINSDSNSFMPYGPAQSPLEVEGPAMDYQQMLRESSQRAAPDVDQGIDR